jgi:hypothetical protein
MLPVLAAQVAGGALAVVAEMPLRLVVLANPEPLVAEGLVRPYLVIAI